MNVNGNSAKEGEYRYFLYSPTQEKELNEVNESMGKKYIVGEVFVEGKYKKFTQLSKNPTNSLYRDTIIIAKGYIEKMKYTKGHSVWKVQSR